MVSLELVVNPAMEEVVFASAAFQNLHSLRRLALRGRLPQHRRRMHRRTLPHLSPSVTHLAAHGLNLTATEWCNFRHLRALDLSQSGGARLLACSPVWPAGGARLGAARHSMRWPLPAELAPIPFLPFCADVRLGPFCGALLSELRELVLHEASLELSSPVVFEDMAALTSLDMEGCTSSRTGSWLRRVLGSSSDAVALPAGLVALRAMGCNVFDKCALHLGAATGLQLLELSSSMQLPATLKHAAPGAILGLHIAEEAQVRGWQLLCAIMVPPLSPQCRLAGSHPACYLAELAPPLPFCTLPPTRAGGHSAGARHRERQGLPGRPSALHPPPVGVRPGAQQPGCAGQHA